MKKLATTMVTLFVLATATTLSAVGLGAQKTPAYAKADEGGQTTLLTPASYEEYLCLQKPADVAVTENYVVIADGNVLFVFDRSAGEWKEHTHTSPVTKIQFGKRDRLYFLDDSMRLYTLSLSDFDERDTGISCTTFTIGRETLYYTNVSVGQTVVRKASLDSLTSSTELYTEENGYLLALSYWNDELYFPLGKYLYRLSLETNAVTEVAKLPDGTKAMTISEGVLLCTAEGRFYGYSINELAASKDAATCTPVANYDGGYTALGANDSDIYLVRGKTVRKYDLTAKDFTRYEIGAASDSPHRLNGGTEVQLVGDRLFIADCDNDRISVYNHKREAFEAAIPSTINDPFLASEGDTLLAASGSQALLYSLEEDAYGQQAAALTPSEVSGTIVGVTSVNGVYYVVTDTNYCYTSTKKSDGEYVWTETQREAHRVDKLTSDSNGFLYALNEDTVYRYTQATFNAPTEQGEKLLTGLPVSTTKLSVDYRGNVYALADNAVYTYTLSSDGSYSAADTITFPTSLVYGVTPKVTSFAFGLEENETYLLYEGDYIAVTTALDLPTVKKIATEKTATKIHGENADFSIVQTKPNALLVAIDLSALQDDGYFPYLHTYRAAEPLTALKVAQTTDYALLSVRESPEKAYAYYLVPNGYYEELQAGDRLYGEEKTGYLSGDTKLYKFPAMGLPALAELPRGEKITLLGELNGLDCDYYKVALGDDVGYVAKAHVNLFDGTPPKTEELTLGKTNSRAQTIWRLAYLILGTGAVCILVDFLILRKRNEEEK